MFEVVARRFAFEPATIEVVEGDRVRLLVRSADGPHGVEIKAFKVKKAVPRAKPGDSPVTIEFVAGAAGEYPILCSEYCGNGHEDMTGIPGGSREAKRRSKRRSMNRFFLYMLCRGDAALAVAGCDEELSSITGPTPNLEPTLSSIQTNIFNMSDSSGRLACIGCHTDQGRAPAGAGLVLLEGRSYQQLVGRPAPAGQAPRW